MTAKHAALVEALTGNFTDHHGYLLKVFLDTVDYLTARIADLDQQIDEAIASLPGPDPGGGPGEGGEPPGPDLIERLDAIPGIGPRIAQVILAELGPDMSAFPTPGHLASWARLCPRTVQSGTKQGRGRPQAPVAGALGLGGRPAALEVSTACSGFNHAPAIADQAIRTGTARRCLVVAADAMSQIADWTDRTSCVLLGDGAAAVKS